MIKLHMQALSVDDAIRAGKLDLHGVIDLAADLRFDGIDLEERLFESMDDDYVESLRLHCMRLGLGVAYIGIRGGFGEGVHGDDEGHLRHIQEWIDVCVKMRVPLLRIIGGAVPPGSTDEKAWPWLAGYMRRVLDYARERRVLVGLHNHNHGMFPATGSQIVRMLDEMDDAYFVHILDTGQFRGSPGASGGRRKKGEADASYDLYREIETSAPRANLVRVKVYRIASGREEWLDYDRIFSILKRVGFNGVMSVVYEGKEWMPGVEAMPLAARFFRAMLAKYEM